MATCKQDAFCPFWPYCCQCYFAITLNRKENHIVFYRHRASMKFCSYDCNNTIAKNERWCEECMHHLRNYMGIINHPALPTIERKNKE